MLGNLMLDSFNYSTSPKTTTKTKAKFLLDRKKTFKQLLLFQAANFNHAVKQNVSL